MATTYDFANSGSFTFINTNGWTSFGQTADGVTFTFSNDVNGGNAHVTFGNASFPTNLYIGDGNSGWFNNDIFTLTLQSTANPSNTQFSGGTGSNAVALQITDLRGSFGRGSVLIEFLTASGVGVAQTLKTSTFINTATIFGTGQFTGIRFTTLSDSADAINIGSLRVGSMNCFLGGTRIATPTGSIAVEDIEPGTKLLTSDGQTTQTVWLGKSAIKTRFESPQRVNPVHIRASALGDNLPENDLYLSPDHAICLDGYLINAGALVNGSTITQLRTMPLEGFTYYHVETDAHELIMAEGVAAETYIDYASADGFDNADERPESSVQEMPLPRISSARMLPDHIQSLIAPAIAAE